MSELRSGTTTTPLNVLVVLPLNDAQRARLEAGAPTAHFSYVCPVSSAHGWGEAESLHKTQESADRQEHASPPATTEQVSAADVIVGNLEPRRLVEARQLRLLQLNSAGFDDYLAAGTLPESVLLASASGAYGQAVSEHLLAMVLCLMKRLSAYRDDQRAHIWSDHGPVSSLEGARVLVLGTGDIGSHFARLASALGAHVTGARRHAGEPPEGFEALVTMAELRGSLGEANVVVSFLPSTPTTRGLVNADFFAAMRPGAFFANGGRGDLVISADLIAALKSGRLAGAALDVTSPEPLPPDHPLWDAPGVLITPHVSGGFHLPVVLNRIVDIAAENLRRLEANEPLCNLVAH